jgi:hypothetical protein
LEPGLDCINDQPILERQGCALDPENLCCLDRLRMALSPCAMARWFSVAQIDNDC